jgi:hypothetical protein
VRHAARLSSWAKRYGASVPRPRLSELRPRSLFDLARENEVEGCVRETFGALVASWQAEHAATAELRSLFASIARDEIAHSELAWQLRAWLRSRLDERERAELDEVQRGAFATLRGELAAEPSAVWCQIAGLPDAAGSARLLSLLVEQLPRLHCLD